MGCYAGSELQLDVDQSGNILTCHNIVASAMSPNGESHAIGRIENPQDTKVNTLTHWMNRQKCRDCVMVQLCSGGCSMVLKELRNLSCNQFFSDFVAYFATGIELFTGFIPYYIEGPAAEENRRDIFGVVKSGEESLTCL